MSLIENYVIYGNASIRSSTHQGEGIFEIQATTASTSATTGALLVAGGAGISGAIFGGSTLDIDGATTLDQTTIDTTDGNFAISGTGSIDANVSGGISLDAQDASNFTVASTLDGQDLTLAVTGATNSSVLISSSGTGSDAIGLSATAGGITVSSSGNLSLDSTTGSVLVGSTAGVPVSIGSSTSTVTVNNDLVITGDLTVNGVTTTFNTETVIIEDNIAIYNSAPAGTADGGIAVKRYQRVDQPTDDVVSHTANASGTTQAGTTATTIILDAGASAVDDFYNGYWIHITGGTRTGDVRRILDYNGTTKVATIYGTSDTDLEFPTSPLNFVDAGGSDFTAYDGVTYTLHGNNYIASVFDESANQWVLVSTAIVPSPAGQVNIVDYMNLQVGGLTVTDSLAVDTITGESGTSVTISNVTIDQGALTGVTSINGATADVVETVSIPDDSTTKVNIVGTATTGAYMVLVTPDYATDGAYLIGVVTKSDATSSVKGNIISQDRGTNNEQLEIFWDASQKVQLKFKSNPGTGGPFAFTVKIISA